MFADSGENMINFYGYINGVLTQCDAPSVGCWVSVVDPTPQEVRELIEDYGLDSGFVKSALDEEESSRIEREDDQTLVIIDTPVSAIDDDKTKNFYTLPMGIIITDEYVFTISIRETQIISEATRGGIRNLRPDFKTRFVLQLLLRISALFLTYLKQIDKISSAAEQELHDAMKNELLMQLLALEKSLVYFSTSLKANEATIEKIFRGRVIKLYDEDQDLLIVMWRLTIVTIILQIPNIMFAFYGINTNDIPFNHTWVALSLTALLTGVTAFALLKWKKKNK